MDKKKGLGRGLASLIEENTPQKLPPLQGIQKLSLSSLVPGSYQPRKHFDPQTHQDLVHSIQTKGVLQPLLVRPHPHHSGQYEIIAGERRWRAAQEVGLSEIPVLIKHFNNEETLEVALIENLQRQDLTPLEEAEGYKRLMDEFNHTQEELARLIGKSRSHVANILRLLTLPLDVQKMIQEGSLSMGHARTLINTEDPHSLAQHIVSQKLNVRQAETLSRSPQKQPSKSVEILSLEQNLSTLLHLPVSIQTKGKGGRFVISFQSMEELDRLMEHLHTFS